MHLSCQGAGFYADGHLMVEPPAPVKRACVATGTGDVLSVCMMLLHHRTDVPVAEKLRLANRIVARFMAGRLTLIPELDAR